MPAAVKSLKEINAELEATRAKRKADQKAKPERQKRDWHGLVYCHANGWTSIIDNNGKGIWLGKTEEIIPYLKSKGIDGEDVGIVIKAIKELRIKPVESIDYVRPQFMGIDGYIPLSPYQPLKAKADRPTVSKNHIGHLATENDTPRVFTPKKQPILDSYKKDPYFWKLLDGLIGQDLGIYRIHSELKKEGYMINRRTLTRWLNKRKGLRRN